MAKSGKAFRTIGEVEAILGVQQHLLRYWESQISEIQPVRRGGRSRLYRPDDLQLIAGIKKLIQNDGLTIRAVQKVIKERGIEHVSGLNPVDLEEPAGVSEAAHKPASKPAREPTGASAAAADCKSGKSAETKTRPETDREALVGIYARLEKLLQRMEADTGSQ